MTVNTANNMPKAIPYGKQSITEADIQSVVDVLRSDFLTQGPMVPRFETAVANYCQAQFAVAVNSATSALHIACLALELGPGDRLWTSPITFVASANCGRYCGAQVDFVDIDPETFNLCPLALEEKLKLAKKQNKLPKVVVAVHMCGQPCQMREIHRLSKEYGFFIIEDASHAIGATYENSSIGNCQYSDITILSFHPVKIITTAEGGMALTNQAELAQKMSLFRSHGITRDERYMTHESEGPWYYEQIELGFNYRMTELQAALGVSQLQRVDEYVAKRHQLAHRYHELLKELPLSTPKQVSNRYSGFHLYIIQLNLDEITQSKRTVFEYMRKQKIEVNLHYIPVHTQPYYQRMGFKVGDYPHSENYSNRAITLPLFPALTHNEQDYVVANLKKAVAA